MDLTKPLKNYKNKVITLELKSNELCITVNRIKYYPFLMSPPKMYVRMLDYDNAEEPYVTYTEKVGFTKTLDYKVLGKFPPETTLAEIRDWLIHQRQLKQIHSLSKEMNL